MSTVSTASARAGFGTRLVAALIDGLILGVPAGLVEARLPQTGYPFAIALSAIYFTYFEGGPAGQGPGKRLMGIRVVDIDTGGPIGYGRAFVRWLGRAISAIAFYLGYLWMLWDPQRQCWHDKLARDLVVPADQLPPPASPWWSYKP